MRKKEILSKIVGRCIAKQRKAVGLTQEKVAERLELSTEAYGRIEQGKSTPTILRLAELADIFDCGLDELVVEASTRADEQANRIVTMLDGVSSQNREQIFNIIEQVCGLAPKRAKKKKVF